MSKRQGQGSIFGRTSVRAAIALGYMVLASLILWPAGVSDTESPPAAAGKATENKAAVAEAPATGMVSAKSATSEAKPAAAAAPAQTPAVSAAAIAALAKITDYDRARWHPLHNKPDIDTATNEQCLACHKEILDAKPRETSPAGVKAAESIAWYQTLDTYKGDQTSFHARHMTTPYAQTTMNLKCNFCHQGNDLREEAPHSSATSSNTGFTLRKMVDTSKTCLMCHGKFPGANMGFDQQTWPELRDGLETPEVPNGCLSCHADQFRTVRHKVNYLNAPAIEAAAKTNADVCYGCHGGRSWYRISYPYPRHSWPGMDPTVPDWAKDRPTISAPEHLTGVQ